jgi:hypothetical protein
MHSRLRARLTYANVMSSMAFFLALTGGTAFAVTAIDDNSVRSNHIVDGEVKNVDVANNQIGTAKIFGNLTGDDIADGGLGGADLADGAVGTEKLANFGVTAGKLASDAVTREKLGFKAVDQNAMDDNSVASAEIVGSTVRADELGAILDRTAVVELDGRTIRTGTATCNTGEQVVSGGVSGIDGRLDMKLSHRSGNGWRATVQNGSNQGERATVHAYCLTR